MNINIYNDDVCIGRDLRVLYNIMFLLITTIFGSIIWCGIGVWIHNTSVRSSKNTELLQKNKSHRRRVKINYLTGGFLACYNLLILVAFLMHVLGHQGLDFVSSYLRECDGGRSLDLHGWHHHPEFKCRLDGQVR